MNRPYYEDLLREIESFYDRVAPVYPSLFGDYSRHQRSLAEKVAALCDLNRWRRVCDVACFSGTLAAELSAYRKLKVYGSDLNKRAIKAARMRKARVLSWRVGEWFNLSGVWRGHVFDVVVCTGNSIVHLPPGPRKRALRGMRSILASDGALIIDTYTEWGALEETTLSPCAARNDHGAISLVMVINEPDKQALLRTVYHLDCRATVDDDCWSPCNIVFSERTTHYPTDPRGLASELRRAGFTTVESLGTWGDEGKFSALVARRG
ncbi:class I SAM-dependent methyltransferase [Thiohalocapsa halophila]|uniref:class I SAM-dependent methyltransferase n=1 Tax=Thiohalocapsa halophila TaxID=69359 RepID=UPI001904D468